MPGRRKSCFERYAENPLYFFKKAFPILDWLPKYRPTSIPYDVVAGITVGLTLLPVSLAYAQMAYLRPEYGLYSSFFGQLIYMFIGSSKDAVIGPSAIGSMLVGRFNLLNPLSEVGDNTYSAALAMVSGLVILAVGLFRLGFIANFFSIPVISGFSTAACFAIIASQFRSLFGIKTPFHGTSFVFIRQVEQVFDNSDEIRLADTLFGLSVIAFLVSVDGVCSLLIRLLFKFYANPASSGRAVPKWVNIVAEVLRVFAASRNSIAFIIATTISFIIEKNVTDPRYRLSLVGDIKPGMPSWKWPQFHLVNQSPLIPSVPAAAGTSSAPSLFPVQLPIINNDHLNNLTSSLFAIGAGINNIEKSIENLTEAIIKPIESVTEMFSKLSTAFIAMPIMSMAELFAIVRAMGRKNGYEVRPTNELVAVGLANIFQSFLGAQPITAATAKTILNNQCHVKSQLSAIISAAIVIISTATLTDVFYYVPKAALAGILIAAALHLFDYPTAIDIWRLYKPDLFFFFFTFTVCLFYNLAFGVLLAIGLSLMTILWSSVRESQLAVVTPAMERQLVRLMSTRSEITRPFVRQNRNNNFDENHIDGPTVSIFMKRDVRFPGADSFTRRMLRCLDDPNGDGSVTVRRLVIDGRFCRHFDYSSLQAWRLVLIKAAEDHKSLVFMNFSHDIRSKLELMLRPIDADFIFDDDQPPHRLTKNRASLSAARPVLATITSASNASNINVDNSNNGDVSTVKLLNETNSDEQRQQNNNNNSNSVIMSSNHFPL